ncbi:DUF4236 domain-containing protein [Halopseudomonas pertucinogena]|uniref:DUF4236 domain-containing protein n=1 Tax=Halopseudomonas pertucinogena TaxID=86175 RepID=A0ABQ2CUA3_9GAMM|nr:DUF4236 domain-containing protein [Halopseudomonas pertucinogena]GGJ06573.1 hypothetical protein GCM10009083_24480 [Halopseudomonas pertucinogena]
MAIRFRKSVKIIPGVRVNFGKKGISTSIGVRGATVNLSKRGTRVTASIPGTGLSATHLYKPAGRRRVSAPPREYSPIERTIAAIAVEILAICLWVSFSGAISFFAALTAFVIPLVLLAQLIRKLREHAAASKELAQLARERVEIEANAARVQALINDQPVKPGRHWTEIVREHDAQRKPGRTPIRQSCSSSGVAKVAGKPTYEYAAQSKNDLDVMLKCCKAESDTYWGQPEGDRACAAPFYFERAAILHRKAKDYASEIDICAQWQAIVDDYRIQTRGKSSQAALVHQSARSQAILARLPKARELLRRQEARRAPALKKNENGQA